MSLLPNLGFVNLGKKERFVRIGNPSNELIKIDDKEYYERRVSLVDKDFFRVFTFEWIEGNKDDALINPFSVVLTETLAKKYFGDFSPIGKDLTIVTRSGDKQFSVKGVIKDMPSNSHFNAEIFLSMVYSCQPNPFVSIQ